MKELSIEEKVKAIDVVKQMVADGQISQDVAEKYFPELRGSEDEKIRNEIVDFIYDKTDTYELREKSNSWLVWLEKQKIEKQGKQNPAWSEEDERMYRGLHNLIYSTPYCDSRKELSDWLESLRPQSTWKPTEKQMETLEYYMHTLLATEHKEVLFGLYNDLKQLKDV